MAMNEQFFTIDELMEGKVPGSVKVQGCNWDALDWCKPFYKTAGTAWRVLGSKNDEYLVVGGREEWRIYVEPKPKVKRWLWAQGSKPHDHEDEREIEWNTGAGFYTEEEVKEVYRNFNYQLKRLDWSETEFDE